jgi:hypothetical protein
MRKLKPTQLASGPKLVDTPSTSPSLPRRQPPAPFVPCTVSTFFSEVDSRLLPASAFSLMSNYKLYNIARIRLNIAKSWL